MVDAVWLENVRAKNRAAYGMDGMGGAQDIVVAQRGERELRTQSIHRGRFEERDPYKPTEGSIESIAQAIGPAGAPVAQPIPRVITWAVGAALLGTLGFVVYKLVRK